MSTACRDYLFGALALTLLSSVLVNFLLQLKTIMTN